MRLIVIFLISFSSYATECKHTENSFKCVKYIRNYDADTITVSLPTIHPFFGKSISVRLYGVDSPEIRTKDKCEKQLARTAKKYVASLLKHSKRIDLINVQKDKYFRLLADVIIDGVSLREKLFKHNFAYPYYGEKKKDINWCNDKQVKKLIKAK